MSKQNDLRIEITNRLIAALEKGVKPWKMPWLQFGGPKNATSRKAYKGVNVWYLSWHMHTFGFDLPVYATFNQWKALGCSVKRKPIVTPHGIYGCPIVFYNIVKKVEGDKESTFPIMKSWNVFNINQVEGEKVASIKESFNVKKTLVETHQQAEMLIAASDAKFANGGDKAYYNPQEDCIKVPERNRFLNQNSYYGTVFHELAHWTGHKSRLNRCPKFEKFGTEAYALEELVAEMAGVYLLSAVNLPVDQELENHASYLDNWLSVLKKDDKVIFTASTAAQAAADYILQKAGMGEKPTTSDEEE